MPWECTHNVDGTVTLYRDGPDPLASERVFSINRAVTDSAFDLLVARYSDLVHQKITHELEETVETIYAKHWADFAEQELFARPSAEAHTCHALVRHDLPAIDNTAYLSIRCGDAVHDSSGALHDAYKKMVNTLFVDQLQVHRTLADEIEMPFGWLASLCILNGRHNNAEAWKKSVSAMNARNDCPHTTAIGKAFFQFSYSFGAYATRLTACESMHVDTSADTYLREQAFPALYALRQEWGVKPTQTPSDALDACVKVAVKCLRAHEDKDAERYIKDGLGQSKSLPSSAKIPFDLYKIAVDFQLDLQVTAQNILLISEPTASGEDEKMYEAQIKQIRATPQGVEEVHPWSRAIADVRLILEIEDVAAADMYTAACTAAATYCRPLDHQMASRLAIRLFVSLCFVKDRGISYSDECATMVKSAECHEYVNIMNGMDAECAKAYFKRVLDIVDVNTSSFVTIDTLSKRLRERCGWALHEMDEWAYFARKCNVGSEGTCHSLVPTLKAAIEASEMDVINVAEFIARHSLVPTLALDVAAHLASRSNSTFLNDVYRHEIARCVSNNIAIPAATAPEGHPFTTRVSIPTTESRRLELKQFLPLQYRQPHCNEEIVARMGLDQNDTALARVMSHTLRERCSLLADHLTNRIDDIDALCNLFFAAHSCAIGDDERVFIADKVGDGLADEVCDYEPEPLKAPCVRDKDGLVIISEWSAAAPFIQTEAIKDVVKTPRDNTQVKYCLTDLCLRRDWGAITTHLIQSALNCHEPCGDIDKATDALGDINTGARTWHDIRAEMMVDIRNIDRHHRKYVPKQFDEPNGGEMQVICNHANKELYRFLQGNKARADGSVRDLLHRVADNVLKSVMHYLLKGPDGIAKKGYEKGLTDLKAKIGRYKVWVDGLPPHQQYATLNVYTGTETVCTAIKNMATYTPANATAPYKMMGGGNPASTFLLDAELPKGHRRTVVTNSPRYDYTAVFAMCAGKTRNQVEGTPAYDALPAALQDVIQCYYDTTPLHDDFESKSRAIAFEQVRRADHYDQTNRANMEYHTKMKALFCRIAEEEDNEDNGRMNAYMADVDKLASRHGKNKKDDRVKDRAKAVSMWLQPPTCPETWYDCLCRVRYNDLKWKWNGTVAPITHANGGGKPVVARSHLASVAYMEGLSNDDYGVTAYDGAEGADTPQPICISAPHLEPTFYNALCAAMRLPVTTKDIQGCLLAVSKGAGGELYRLTLAEIVPRPPDYNYAVVSGTMPCTTDGELPGRQREAVKKGMPYIWDKFKAFRQRRAAPCMLRDVPAFNGVSPYLGHFFESARIASYYASRAGEHRASKRQRGADDYAEYDDDVRAAPMVVPVNYPRQQRIAEAERMATLIAECMTCAPPQTTVSVGTRSAVALSNFLREQAKDVHQAARTLTDGLADGQNFMAAPCNDFCARVGVAFKKAIEETEEGGPARPSLLQEKEVVHTDQKEYVLTPSGSNAADGEVYIGGDAWCIGCTPTLLTDAAINTLKLLRQNEAMWVYLDQSVTARNW